MILPDKIYDIIKWILIDIPTPLVTLLTSISQIYNIDLTSVTLTIAAVFTFLVAVLLESNFFYKLNGIEEQNND